MWRGFLPGTSPSKLVNDGIDQFNRKNYVEAIECFTRALEMDGNSAIAAIAWGRKGNCYVNLNQYTAAVECYERSLEINPASSNIWFIKGYVLKLLSRNTEALACFTQALEINPEYSSAWESLGDVLVLLQRFEEAEAAYTSAVELNPDLKTKLDDRIALCRVQKANAPSRAAEITRSESLADPSAGSMGQKPIPALKIGNSEPSDNGGSLEDIFVYEETVKQFLASLEETSWKIFRSSLEGESTTLQAQIKEQRRIIQELSSIIMEEQELIQKLQIILEIQSNFIDRIIKEDDAVGEKAI